MKVSSKEKISINLHKNLSQETENFLKNEKRSNGSRNSISMHQKKKKNSSDKYMKLRRHTNEPKTSGKFKKRMRGWSINTYNKGFISKKLIGKTKEIYGINRIAIFNRD